MTNAFSRPLFLLEEDTDSTLIALISGSLVYKTARSTRQAIREATKLLWMLMHQWQFLVPRGLLQIFPALTHRYQSKENLAEHVEHTNSNYQFTDSREDLVSKKTQHLANVGAFFFTHRVRNKAFHLNDDDYFGVAATMLRHVVTAEFAATKTLGVGPAQNFVWGSTTRQEFHYFKHNGKLESHKKLPRED